MIESSKVFNSHRPLGGILFCIFALLLFAIQDSIIKGLSGQYPILEILLLRSVIVFVLLVAIGVFLQGVAILRGRNPLPLLVRGVLAFFAFTSYYIALQKIPLADAAAVFLTAPLFVTLLSGLLLAEKVGIHRWVAIAIGFSAVLIMLNPGSSLFRIESVIPLFSALCYAMIPIINRRIGMSEPVLTMGIYTTLTYLGLMLLASMLVNLLPLPATQSGILAALFQRWLWFSIGDICLILVTACLFSVALLCITQAYRIAIVSSVAPFEYSYLLWASIIGYLYFGDVPGIRTLVGGSLVVVSGCYIVYQERKEQDPSKS